ncbi:MAG: phage tail sheath family protein [Anaerolineaceae bacterium]|nr:phage tail sheath family protein [Anaerolineaceae bacterium]
MPVSPTYPGVYIEEIPSGVRTITGVATSITAFVGRALRGPVEDPITINSYGEYERVFGGLWLESAMSYAVRDFFQNGGGQAVIVRLHRNATTAEYDLLTDAASPNNKLTLLAANPGSWGTKLSITVDHTTKTSAADLFNVVVTDTISGAIEKHLNVSILTTDPRFVGRVLETSSLVRGKKNSGGAFIVPNVRPKKATTTIVAANLDGAALTATEIATGSNLEDNKRGLYALAKTDLFNMLCIPPYLANEYVNDSVITAAATYCEKRRAFYILDPKPKIDWSNTAAVKTAISTGLATSSKNAAIFFPRIQVSNPLHDNQLEEFAPCGAIAGVFARTDAERGIWKAPAGMDATLNGVPELAISLIDKEIGDLNQLGVNCLKFFPFVGRVVWGSRTLQGKDILASEWKYIPVRRMALYIEESLFRGTQWVVFEPNDEPLWAQIRLNVGAFMNTLFRQGAFQGASPREAYFVRCDKETTTQDDINRGVVNILVGFAPLKPAEFVFIKLQQIAGQIQV